MDKLFVKAEIQREDKKLIAIASTSVEDRHGEVVDINGWDTKNFKKNPVLLWAHNHDLPAIGYAKNLKKDMSFEPVFHDKTDMAKAIKALYEGYTDEEGNEIPPILNSFSVGFKAIDMDGNKYTKQELLEISAVNVPANPEARVVAYKGLEKMFGKDTVEKLDILTTDDVKGDDEEEDVEELKERLEEAEKTIKELVKGLQHLNPAGRKSEVVTQRLALSKVVARAADRMLEAKPQPTQAQLAKVVKRAAEKLIVDHKQELKSGKNQGSTQQS